MSLYEMIQSPEGTWLPVMSASMETLADGRIVRALSVSDTTYTHLHIDMRDGSEEWIKLDIGETPLIEIEENGDE